METDQYKTFNTDFIRLNFNIWKWKKVYKVNGKQSL